MSWFHFPYSTKRKWKKKKCRNSLQITFSTSLWNSKYQCSGYCQYLFHRSSRKKKIGDIKMLLHKQSYQNHWEFPWPPCLQCTMADTAETIVLRTGRYVASNSIASVIACSMADGHMLRKLKIIFEWIRHTRSISQICVTRRVAQERRKPSSFANVLIDVNPGGDTSLLSSSAPSCDRYAIKIKAVFTSASGFCVLSYCFLPHRLCICHWIFAKKMSVSVPLVCLMRPLITTKSALI